MNEFENIINKAWDERDQVSGKSDKSILNAVGKTIDQVDSGKIRVAEKKDGEWVVHQWIKKAILLSFRLNDNEIIKA